MNQGFWARVSDRTFISYLGSYLLGSWAIIQFVDWIIERYGYSKVVTDILLLFLVLIIPGVIIFAWIKAGDQKNVRIGTWTLPVNIVIAFLAVFYISNSQLLSTTQTVTVTNEDGEEVLRAIPNQVMAKRIVLFPFTASSSTTPKWELLGWAKVQALDIEQDNRIFTNNGLDLSFKKYVEDYKHDLFDEIPFSVQRKITQDHLADYWITCSLGDSLIYKVYSSEEGQEVLSKSYPKTNIYNEIDAFTSDLSETLFNREFLSAQKKIIDLPASELLSVNTSALESFFKGRMASLLENNHAKAANLMQEAVKEDPNFATAYSELGSELYFSGQPNEAISSYEEALNLIDPLPERQQFEIKQAYYGVSQNVVKLIRLLEMWKKLYPNDYRPYADLFTYYQSIGQFDKANAIGEQALEAGHRGPMLLNLARLNITLSRFDQAEQYLKSYQETYPDKAANTKEIGELYLKQGKFEEAINFFEELTVLDPSNHNNFLSLANVLKDSGQFKEAEKMTSQALRKAATLQDTITIYSTQENILADQGKMKACIELMENRWSLLRKVYPEIAVTGDLMRPDRLIRYISTAKEKQAKQMLSSSIKKIQNDQVDIECVALINYYVASEDGKGLKNQMEQCGDDVTVTSGPLMTNFIVGLQELYLGSYQTAIEKIELFIDSSGLENNEGAMTTLAEAYRLNGQIQKALELYDQIIKIKPNRADILYDHALCLSDADQPEAAIKQVEKALDILKNADKNYSILLEAQKLLNEIRQKT